MQGDKYNSSRTFTYDQYAEFLIQRYRSYLEVIYFICQGFEKKEKNKGTIYRPSNLTRYKFLTL